MHKGLRPYLFKTLRKNNIGVNLHYYPVHLQPYYKKLGFKEGNYINSEEYSKEAISLPIYPNLNRKDQNRICKIIKEEIQKYAR